MPRSRPDKIALFLADVDGTLVNRDKLLTARAQQSVRDMDAQGIKFAITSGRPPKGMKMLFEPLLLTTPIAGFNGGLFVSSDLRIIESHTLDPAAARRTVDLIEQAGLDVWIYCGDDWLLRDIDAPHREREEHTVQFPPKVVPAFTDEHLKTAVKIVGVSNDLDRVAGTGQQGFGRALAAILPRCHPPQCQQGRGGRLFVAHVRDRSRADRHHRRSAQRRADVQAERLLHRHGQCQRGRARGGRCRDGQLRRGRVCQGRREVYPAMNGEIVVLRGGNAIARHVAEWLLAQALAKRAAFTSIRRFAASGPKFPALSVPDTMFAVHSKPAADGRDCHRPKACKAPD
jgi:haloacid dehalogenase-like hydrolase